MALGKLIKAGIAIGAGSAATEKLIDQFNDVVTKSAEQLNQNALVVQLGGAEALIDKPRKLVSKPSVTTKCVGCHAPLTGVAGSTCTCPYCDTTQTIN